jgi:hypothetical protein
LEEKGISNDPQMRAMVETQPTYFEDGTGPLSPVLKRRRLGSVRWLRMRDVYRFPGGKGRVKVLDLDDIRKVEP